MTLTMDWVGYLLVVRLSTVYSNTEWLTVVAESVVVSIVNRLFHYFIYWRLRNACEICRKLQWLVTSYVPMNESIELSSKPNCSRSHHVGAKKSIAKNKVN